MLKITRNCLISSFVGSPFCRNSVGGCGLFSTAIRSSTTVANQSADDVPGICVCRGKNSTVFDLRVSPVDGI